MVPLLKPTHIQACLKFSREHQIDSEEGWENVLCPDETKIEINGMNVTCVLRRTNDSS